MPAYEPRSVEPETNKNHQRPCRGKLIIEGSYLHKHVFVVRHMSHLFFRNDTMFSLRMQMFRARKSSGLQAPSRARSRLCLESLEERALLNGGPLLSVASGSSGGPPAPLVGIVDSNGGTPGGSASSGG